MLSVVAALHARDLLYTKCAAKPLFALLCTT